jgi:hypothetical protein
MVKKFLMFIVFVGLTFGAMVIMLSSYRNPDAAADAQAQAQFTAQQQCYDMAQHSPQGLQQGECESR